MLHQSFILITITYGTIAVRFRTFALCNRSAKFVFIHAMCVQCVIYIFPPLNHFSEMGAG